MTLPLLQPDIAILGGGVAGLWTLNRLRDLGYGALLFEPGSLGGGQTCYAQGIIHGGLKYQLGGTDTDGARALAAMPDTWRRCLAGNGPVDLRACRVLSEYMHLSSTGSLPARTAAFLAGRAMRAGVTALTRAEQPALLQAAAPAGGVYRVDEPVLDVPSLVDALAQRHQDALFALPPEAALRVVDGRARLALPHCEVEPAFLLLTAGAGNAGLLGQLGAARPAMQLRPLRQVLVSHDHPGPLFLHCIGSGSKPLLTITSHRDARGRPAWYLGGELAEDGAALDEQALVERARASLARCLPGLDLGEARFTTLAVSRAEAAREDGGRPDHAHVEAVPGLANVLVAWPTKLALTPALGEAMEAAVRRVEARADPSAGLAPLTSLGRPARATAPWGAAAP